MGKLIIQSYDLCPTTERDVIKNLVYEFSLGTNSFLSMLLIYGRS